MKILFLSTWYPYPPDNGSRIRAHHLLKALCAVHDVHVVAFQPDPDPAAAWTMTGAAVHPVAADPFGYVRAASTTCKFLSPIPLALKRNLVMDRKLATLGSEYDAVVAIQGPVACYASRYLSTPLILDVDTSLSYQQREWIDQATTRAERFRHQISWLKSFRHERQLFRRFDACTVAAEQEVAHVKTMVAPARVEVIPNGVDCEQNRPDFACTQPNTLVYNGALTYDANFDAMQYFLREIFPLVVAQEPATTLTITGSTAGVDLDELALTPEVRLSGYLADVRPVVGGAAVCVIPIRKGGGTRLKILEAMALGTPVISTTKGAEGLDVVDGEHLLIANDPEEFAARTVELLNNQALQQRLVANARRLVEQQYDWKQIGQRFLRLVEEVVRERVLASA